MLHLNVLNDFEEISIKCIFNESNQSVQLKWKGLVMKRQRSAGSIILGSL